MEQLELLDTPVNRTGPILGYATQAKEAYRESVWSCFDEAIPELGSSRVVILPSSEGLELQTALRHGVPAGSIIAVDNDLATLNSAPWRTDTKLSEVTVIHSQVGKLHLHSKEPIKIANLDLTGAVSKETAKEIRGFFDNNVFTDTFYMAVTVARGREPGILSEVLNNCILAPPGVKCSRMAALWRILNFDKHMCTVMNQGGYRGDIATHNMTWAVFRFEKRDTSKSLIMRHTGQSGNINAMSREQIYTWNNALPAAQLATLRLLDEGKSLSTLEIWQHLRKQNIIDDTTPLSCLHVMLASEPNVRSIDYAKRWALGGTSSKTLNWNIVRQAIRLYLCGTNTPKTARQVYRHLLENKLIDESKFRYNSFVNRLVQWPEFKNKVSQGKMGLWVYEPTPFIRAK